jgi:hypothetical protein
MDSGPLDAGGRRLGVGGRILEALEMKPPEMSSRRSALSAALFVPYIACSQMPAVPPAPPQGLQALVQSAASNNQRLRAYRWVETTTISVGGRLQPPLQAICWYAADGTISRLPIGPTRAEPPGGLAGHSVLKSKIAEVKAEIGAARELNARYLPIRPDELGRALQTRRVEFQRDSVNDEYVLIMDYEKPGDQLRLNLDPVTKQLRSIAVGTYFASPAEPMQAAVQFATLEDGTRYPRVTTLEAPSKQLSIRIDNAGFSPVG